MLFLHEILKYQDGRTRDNGWWEIGHDGYVYNRRGGRHSYVPSEDDEIVEKEDWSDIIKATVRDDTYATGWIDTNGEFYGCARTDHALMAEYYFGQNEVQLENMGYVKVYELPMEVMIEKISNGGDSHMFEAYLVERSTIQQRDKLENMGFCPAKEGSNIWIK